MKGGTLGPALVPGKPADSKLIHAMKYVGSPSADAAQRQARGRGDCRFRSVDCRRRAGSACRAQRPPPSQSGASSMTPSSQKGRQWWAFQAVKVLPAAGLCARVDGADEARSFCVRQAGRERADAVATGRRSHADSPRLHRSDRPQADLRRSRGVRQRRVAEQIREARRHTAGHAAVRRAMGTPLARRRAVRRGQSRQHHEPAVSARVAVSRLGHRGAEQGCALRPLRQAAARGRSHARHVAPRHAGARARSRSARRITKTCDCRSTSSARCN